MLKSNAKELAFAAAAAAVSIVAICGFLLLHDRGSRPPIVIQDIADSGPLEVWIGGAVATPGVYEFQPGARVDDAITAAGGLTADADVSTLNPAGRLHDEDRIEIPSLLAAASPRATTASIGLRAPTPVSSPVLDINTASAADLDALPGIGPVLAQRIVDFREANGPFDNIQELAQVSGISPNMVNDLANLIVAGQ